LGLIDVGAQLHHLVNAIESSMCGDDAALLWSPYL